MKFFFLILLILKFAFSHVYADIINNIEVKNNNNETVNLIYDIELGEKALIKNIIFTGEKYYKDKKLKNIIAHDTDMKIPISNSIYMGDINQNFVRSNNINIDILNSLNLQNVKIKKFPVIKILNRITKKESLFDNVIVSVNDELVNLFLENKIEFLDIPSKIWHFINLPLFSKFKHQKPKNLAQIEKLNEFVRLKSRSLSVISQKK